MQQQFRPTCLRLPVCRDIECPVVASYIITLPIIMIIVTHDVHKIYRIEQTGGLKCKNSLTCNT